MKLMRLIDTAKERFPKVRSDLDIHLFLQPSLLAAWTALLLWLVLWFLLFIDQRW